MSGGTGHGVGFRGRRHRTAAAAAVALWLVAVTTAVIALPVAGATRAHRHTAGPAHHKSAPAPAATRPSLPVPQGTGPPFQVRMESIALFDPSRSTPARAGRSRRRRGGS